MDSLAFVWPAANWAEREAHDLWGIEFQGHPGLAPPLRGSDADSGLLPTVPDATHLVGGRRYPSAIGGPLVRLKLDGERIVEARPELGYWHSGVEEQLRRWSPIQGVLLAARTDGFSAMHGDLAYALAAEKLLGVGPPPRAQHWRVIYGELQRIASHLYWLSGCVQNLCGPSFAASAYAGEGRTAILDLFQWLGGNPIAPDVIAIGGLKQDAPPGLASRLRALLTELETLFDDLDRVLTHSRAFRSRLEGVGVIDPGTALGLGVTGPSLRATGIDYDVRTAFPYAGYDAIDISIPIGRGGDADARYQVRMAEMRASLEVIRQALSLLPTGPVNAFPVDGVPPAFPKGAAYASVEGARGEWGILLVSDGSPHWQRAHVRGPSFANLSAVPFVMRELSLDQATVALDSLDISMSEVER